MMSLTNENKVKKENCKMKLSENIKLSESIVGKRYESLDLLKNDIETCLKRNVKSIIESESERMEELDFMIDYCFEDDENEIETIWYLKDNAGRYYITEV
jgi:hypothetical protein